MSFYSSSFYGGNSLWNDRINSRGFMGFVDKVWLLCNRLNVIIVMFMLVLLIISLIVSNIPGCERFSVSRLRHQNRKYN